MAGGKQHLAQHIMTIGRQYGLKLIVRVSYDLAAQRNATTIQRAKMLISDVRCRCGAEYERAESSTYVRSAAAEAYRCELCGSALDLDDPSTLVAYRLVVTPEAPPGAL